ncbi:cache domain-containing protein, partial [Methylobacterium soli]
MNLPEAPQAPDRNSARPRAGPGRWRTSLAILAGTVAVLIVIWAAGRIAERWALGDLRRAAQTTLGLQIGALHAEMQRQSALPLALAADPEIAALLAPDPAAGLAERVNDRLAELAAATGAAVIYVIGADGLTVAASNAREARSFIGQNYAFRPYFRRALAEGSGSQFALGTISGRPGLYLTRRLPEARGIVVVKIEFDAVEAVWRAGRETVFVTDPRGIVLVASNPDWRFRSLRPIAPDERAR